MSTSVPQNRASFTVKEIVFATGGELVSHTPQEVSLHGVATDTREVLESKLFVALRGEKFDGHAFAEWALGSGAGGILVEDRALAETIAQNFMSLGRGEKEPAIIVVKDTLVGLGDVAAFHRSRSSAAVVAVVGSAGKTTTRSAISALLNEIFPGRVHSTVGNLNNRVGVPMTVLSLSEEHDFLVVEVGTNQRGEVAELGRIVRADVGVLTLIDLEHTEGLGDLDGVEEEERALFAHMSPGATAIGFGEDARVLRSIEQAPVEKRFSYGFEQGRDLVIKSRRFSTPYLSLVHLERSDHSTLTVESPLVGRPGALALSAAVLTVETLLGRKLSREECERALEEVGEPGRSTVRVLSSGVWILDDTYNSNPASVENSIQTGRELAEASGGHLWLVLGEMLELGSLSEEAHREMGAMAGRSGAAGAFFIQGAASISAEKARPALPIVRFCEYSTQVPSLLLPLLSAEDVVVVKASRGVRAERVVEGLAATPRPFARDQKGRGPLQ